MDTAALAMAQNAADRAETHAGRAAEAAAKGWARLAGMEAGLAEDGAEDAEAALAVVLSAGERAQALSASIAARDAWAATAQAASTATDAWRDAHTRTVDRLREAREFASGLLGLESPRDPPPLSQ